MMQAKQKHLNTLTAIENYLKLDKSSAMEYFVASKKNCRHDKIRKNGGIIKKEIHERHYLNGVTYINPNVLEIISRIKKSNASSADRIRQYIYNNTTLSR